MYALAVGFLIGHELKDFLIKLAVFYANMYDIRVTILHRPVLSKVCQSIGDQVEILARWASDDDNPIFIRMLFYYFLHTMSTLFTLFSDCRSTGKDELHSLVLSSLGRGTEDVPKAGAAAGAAAAATI